VCECVCECGVCVCVCVCAIGYSSVGRTTCTTVEFSDVNEIKHFYLGLNFRYNIEERRDLKFSECVYKVSPFTT